MKSAKDKNIQQKYGDKNLMLFMYGTKKGKTNIIKKLFHIQQVFDLQVIDFKKIAPIQEKKR